MKLGKVKEKLSRECSPLNRITKNSSKKLEQNEEGDELANTIKQEIVSFNISGLQNEYKNTLTTMHSDLQSR